MFEFSANTFNFDLSLDTCENIKLISNFMMAIHGYGYGLNDQKYVGNTLPYKYDPIAR